MNEGKMTGYMDLVDFEHELGYAMGGNVVYPSIEDLKEHRKCVHECGIIKVEVVGVEIVQEQDFSKYDSPAPEDRGRGND